MKMRLAITVVPLAVVPLAAASFAALLATISSTTAQDWPAFRGPTGDGVSLVARAPLTWSREDNIRWKVAMPRPGNGSAIVSNGRVFVTSAQDAKGRRRSLYCLDRKNGAELWVRTAEFDKVMPTHKTNPYCGTTPVADGERVVVWRGSAGIACYDFLGKELWQRDLGEFRHAWGYGTSPLLHDGLVLLNPGAGKKTMIVALRLSDGAIVWQHDEPQAPGGGPKNNPMYVGTWSTPVILERADGDRLVCVLPTRVVAFDVKSGDLAWSCDGVRNHRGDLAYSSPLRCGDLLFVGGGWDGPGLGIRLGGNGDVTKSHRVWRSPIYANFIGTGVFVAGSAYCPRSGGSIVCIDPQTGENRWRKSGARGRNWGSIVYAAGRLYSTNQAGTTLVLKPNPEKLEVLAKNELGETCNATPAFSDGEIFLRTHGHLYCIAESGPSKPKSMKQEPPQSKPARRAIR